MLHTFLLRFQFTEIKTESDTYLCFIRNETSLNFAIKLMRDITHLFCVLKMVYIHIHIGEVRR